ncbi:2'-5' RNA ligase family protein [Streptacidiphilus sp. ASG 303]|uniref:2'-5' RNA ligase family protein n=1 Tax=Streptacidiphilus sp. ASG 303 TaxID=2896847 RepID=UPI001E33007C|nr:2'-5' RNA ligase family protein [Streptacidiphilus sp. ASG 303]MCD0481124.1 2'-5' RNA ligase family protein [Streptacidiphilus sp. ASG 303]
MRTVELTCDPDFDDAVRAVWGRLDAAGLPSLTRNTHPTHRPHLTLAAAGAFPPGALERIDDLLAPALPLRVRLAGLLSFSARSRRRVLAWGIVPTPELLAVHGAVWAALDGADEPHPLYTPGRWMPHMSLTRRLEPEQLVTALEVLGRLPDHPGDLDAGRSYDTDTRTTVPLGAA